MKRPRQFGSKQPTRAYQRAALQMVLVQRETLDALNVASLARSHGMAVADVEKAVADELRRRVG